MNNKIKVGTIRPDGRRAPKTVRDLRNFDIETLDEELAVNDEHQNERRRRQPPKRD